MKISTPQNIDFNSISAIIFDWGDVITKLLPENTIQAFQNLGLKHSKQYFGSLQTNPYFLKLEEGKIKPEVFYDSLNKEIGKPIDYGTLNQAVCTLLGETPKKNIHILLKLKNMFPLFLLSNTSIVHTNYYIPLLKESHQIIFPNLFNKVYFSYEVGIRKPHESIFKKVISDNNLLPESTLFLDDTVQNIEAAHKLGLQCFRVTEQYPMELIFEQLHL